MLRVQNIPWPEENETGGENCFQKSFEKEEKLMGDIENFSRSKGGADSLQSGQFTEVSGSVYCASAAILI